MSPPRIVERYRPAREVYIRDMLWLAALGMVGALVVLYLIGNPYPWVGPVAALLAIGVRGAYLYSEEMAREWHLTETSLRALPLPGVPAQEIPLSQIVTVRRLGGAVQVITRDGTKMLLKFLPDPRAVVDRLSRAAGLGRG